jgi:hypothetical protein
LSAPPPDLTPLQSFFLAPVPVGENETPRSKVLLDGTPTSTTVPGVVLEAQYRYGEGYLLLTTENIPYEEALHILLLDQHFRVLDHLELSHAFAPGTLTDLEPAGDGRLHFSLFGGDRWELTVLPASRRLRLDEAPTGVRGRIRRLLAPRWLAIVRLQAMPAPQR